MKQTKWTGAALAAAVLMAGLVWWCARPAAPAANNSETAPAARAEKRAAAKNAKAEKPRAAEPDTPADAPDAEDAAADAEEKLVDAFDDLTDTWREPKESGVTMDDVAKFCGQFKKVPEARREECLHRALNLVPDENVMLLAGILMDKSIDKELVELVYNDVLNRSEDVKKPILQQIFKDKTHPCWTDTAWILDVTGELPKKDK